jgi:single-stranded DNA-specific DHH superfamily exonuclease
LFLREFSILFFNHQSFIVLYQKKIDEGVWGDEAKREANKKQKHAIVQTTNCVLAIWGGGS